MDKMTEQDGASLDIVDENIQALKEIFPEAFTEGKVDFEVLRQLLGDVVDEGEEKYGLNWHGKKKARQIALTPSTGTLRPCPEESVDWDTTQNLFIEGDNLEVLKLLQKSYANKVKMIYIDPPYNTGKEFIYPDKFQDNLDTYLRYTGQKGEDGFKTSSNTESSGRYHTNWLNMMYPRLKIAKNLLKDDGVIFISSDDTEQPNLRKICDEIFGEDNFVASLIWQKRDGAPNDRKMGYIHEHILVFGISGQPNSTRTLAEESFNLMPRTDKANSQYKVFTEPNGPDQKGPFRKIDTTANAKGGRDVKSLHYSLTNPYTGEKVFPRDGTCWRHSEEEMKRLQEENRLYWGVKGTATTPMRKLYLSEAKQGMTTPSILPNMPFNQHAAREIETLLGKKSLFETPKPVNLLKLLVHIGTKDDDIVMDFFAGSCSLADAILVKNKEEESRRTFIMVQLPEPCDEKSEAFKAGYKTIADIGKERIRRSAAKIKEENPDYQGDLGFKVFKLDSSNIRAWNPDRNDLEGTLIKHSEHLLPGRTEEDILYELLLKRGVDLTVPIEQKEIVSKTVYSIGYGVLFACLDTTINRDEVEELALGIAAWHKELEPASDTQVVFRDSAFADDVAKTNMTAILEQNGIKHVRSL
jgi:adenine-specific DNA-methyltransferase